MTNLRFTKEFKNAEVGELFLMMGDEGVFVKTGKNAAALYTDLAKGYPVTECEFWCGDLVRCYEWRI